MGARQFLERLLQSGPGGDARPGSAEPDSAEPPATEAAPSDAHRRQRLAQEPRRLLSERLALKLLESWLRDRQRALFPLTLDFTRLDARSRWLLVQMAVAAALADGKAVTPERIGDALANAGAGEAELHLLPEALASPAPLSALLREVQEARLGAHAYAASLIALGHRSRVNRAWLDYLAARLGLPAAVTTALHRRHGGRMVPGRAARVSPAPR
ncbi:DUF533 domain-containing protein [Siccirubricoccus sp. G192]|uniref:DUF533 domain-containing protein n=1 Tax=Siccirubricoccus sp. G192 TaxID=2849651 RepID=UPI001C2BD735|nr:DUF533 domain-containing protein [Siccirubricoccus sp. G192]MBV1798263.1 tellurite resistance TerB family protein [Siccirubricoccus sp. G192]